VVKPTPIAAATAADTHRVATGAAPP
jgi:hypothetical protein